MTESAFTRKLIAALRKTEALRDAWIVKHNDATTGGVPDFSVTVGRHTEWFEVKLHPNRPTKLQAWTLEQIGAGGHLIIVEKELYWAALDEAASPPAGDEIGWLTEKIATMFAAAGRYSDLVEGCAEHKIPLVEGRCPKCRDAEGKPFVFDMQSKVLLPQKE